MDLPRRLLIVRHGDIPGFMPAMTMGYSIAVPKEVETLGAGDKISADLVVSEGKARLEKIVLLEKVSQRRVRQASELDLLRGLLTTATLLTEFKTRRWGSP